MMTIYLGLLLVPLSFWDAFIYAVPRMICETPFWSHHRAVVTPKQYTAENLIDIGRAFARESRDAPVSVLYMAPRHDSLSYVLAGHGGQFDNWQHNARLFLREGPQVIYDIAEVNVIEGEAVLRLRKDGKVSRYVLTGKDPLLFEIDGQDFEVLEFYGDLTGTNVKREYGDGGMLSISTCEDCLSSFDVSVRTRGELRMETFRKLVDQLAAVPIPADLDISLRRDTWFVPTKTFPILYAFDDEPPDIPTREEYDAAGELSAWVIRSKKTVRLSEWIDGNRVHRGEYRLAVD